MLIKNFTQLGRNDAGIAGGKGASLGEMTSAGIPVPPGFVVLSESFEQFLRETDLGVEIDTILHTVDTQAMHTIEHASERIQKLILEAKMPADIESDIENHFQKLEATYVAVRSSATAEDSASAAWAGQLDSFLNTIEATLLQNVQKCWASLFTPRAIFYRFEQGLHATKISVAVVVQKMVESEVSGIAFSVHPVTEDRNQLIIEAGYGLGEAIVSGQITPDSYVVEKSPRRIIDKNIAKQERGIYRAVQTANEWLDIEDHKQDEQKLTDEQILELSEIIVTIENHYGFPCDIEWAYEKGFFYIVQSRPITTLQVKRVQKNVSDSLVKAINGKEWVYIVKRSVVPCMIEMIFEGERQDRLQEILQESVKHVSNIRLNDGSAIYSKEGIASVNEAIKNIVSKDGYDGLVRLTEIFSERMKEFLEYLKGEHITLEGFRRKYTAVSGFLVLGVFPEKYLTEELQHLITKKCGTFDQDYFSAIAYPSEINDATNEVLALIDMALMMRREGVGVENEVIHQKIEEHLRTYAWLGSRWSMEDGFTEHDIVTRLESYLRSSALEEEKENIEAPRKQADEKTKEFLVQYNLSDDEKNLVMAVKTFCFFRTHRSESLVKATFLLKQYIEYHPQEFPFSIEEIKYLTVTEVLSGRTKEELLLLAQERRRGFVGVSVDGMIAILSGRECQIVTSLENIMKTLPREVANQEVTGQVGYGGVVQGRVKIVASEVDIVKVCSGDILVATMTFPHYIAAMEVASGFVTDEGGILCHAAIIAREMKKPCVIGTKIATQVLKDGDLVEVDADTGVVRIVEKAK